MKKFFLIPLMAMLCTVMAWGANVTYPNANYGNLASAIASAGAGGTVTLSGDVALTSYDGVNNPVTINLNGHTLNGATLMAIQGSQLTITGNGTFSPSMMFGGQLIFDANFTGIANPSFMMTMSGCSASIQGTQGKFGSSIQGLNPTLPFGKTLAIVGSDTYYSVVNAEAEPEAEPIAQIGNVQYTSLEAAFAEAPNGYTIQLIDDVVMDYEDDEESDIIVIDNNRCKSCNF